MTTKRRSQPSGRFNAQTWVDDQKQLWLYGGRRVIRINGSDIKQLHLHDLWKFNPGSYQWSKITNQNSSKQPQFNRGSSCFCRGEAFVFGHQKKFPELWVYNISSNSWNLIQSPSNIKNTQDCFAMWCNQDSGIISMLCHENTVVMKLWIFKITSGIWSSQTFSNKFTNTSDRSISSQISVWNDPDGLVYVYMWSHSNQNIGKNSVLLSISHDDIVITEVNDTKQEYMSNRKGFIRWIDSHGNLHLLGGRITNVTTNSSAAHWMLNLSDYTWVTVNSKNIKPSARAGACFWQVDGNLWLFGGYRKDGEGQMVVLNDFWIGNTSRPVVVHRPTLVDRNLPGDTLGLSLVNKLIISLVTLFVVMAVSVRLCYKRELNQFMSRLQKNRVLYHQLSQEGDKSTRL